jgi:hypothetical protein
MKQIDINSTERYMDRHVKMLTSACRCAVVSMVCAVTASAVAAQSTTATYQEGWYQIKRTIGISEVADMDFTNITAMNSWSLLNEVSYLNTGDEIPVDVTIPIVNVNAGRAVYGARLMPVNGLADYTADFLSSSGNNVNEKELSTYYYITPIAADDDGEWSYTIRSVNGHYMGPNGRYYAEPKAVYINSSLGFSIDETTDAMISTLSSFIGSSIGSKQLMLSSSMIDDIPYIDRLDGYEQLKEVLDSIGDVDIKLSEYTWAKKTVVDAATGDSVQCIGSTGMLEVLSAVAQNSEQIMTYYNEEDYESMARLIMSNIGVDLFKLKKLNLSNITTSSGTMASHIKVTPYTVSLIGFGDNFSLTGVDYNTIDALTQLLQKTNQNAMAEYSGRVANASALTKVYDGGTLFVTDGTSLDDEAAFSLVNDAGTDVVDLSRAQYFVDIDNSSHTVNFVVSSPKKSAILSQWSDNYKTVRINNVGYSTLYTPFELAIPEAETSLWGAVDKNAPKVYVAKQRDDENIYFTEVAERIPANTAVLISGDANRSYNFSVIEAENASEQPIDAGLLQGRYATYTVPVDVNAYVLLTNENNLPEFTRLVNESSSTIDAWQAYFVTEDVDAPSSYNIVFGEAPAAITSVLNNSAENASVEMFDITGRKVNTSTPAPGIYIINGKKTVVH